MTTLTTEAFLNAAMKRVVAALLTVAADDRPTPQAASSPRARPCVDAASASRHHASAQEYSPEQHRPFIRLDALGEGARRAPRDRRRRNRGETERDLVAGIVSQDDLRFGEPDGSITEDS